MTSILVILLPILVVAGAFMWMQPSKRDQRLAKLRTGALSHGFRIGSIKVSDTSEHGRVNEKKEIVTVYQRSLVLSDNSASSFTVLRTTGESGIYLPEGWQWDDRKGLTESQYNSLNKYLESITLSINVVSLTNDMVSFSWDEVDQSITFDLLKRWLFDLAVVFDKEII